MTVDENDTPESIAGYSRTDIGWYWTSSAIQWQMGEARNITHDGTYWPTGGNAFVDSFHQRPVLYLNKL